MRHVGGYPRMRHVFRLSRLLGVSHSVVEAIEAKAAIGLKHGDVSVVAATHILSS